jgi:argininosuccinate lyase
MLRDECHWLSEMNKAACVALVTNGIIDRPVGANIAKALCAFEAAMLRNPSARTGDYKLAEPLLINLGGLDMTRLHAGRSRMDLVATNRRLVQRDALLAALRQLNTARASLLKFADLDRRALLPVYTQGRQSAAVPLGHYVGAYLAALEQEATALRDTYAQINQSPLGAGAGATSRFPIDRALLARCLGFEGVVENSLFAIEMSLLGLGARITASVNSGALIVSTLVADIEIQYARTIPWFTVREREGSLTSRSTSMPHKVNPTILNRVRMLASDLIGMGVSYLIKSHNVQHGMPDFKTTEPTKALLAYAGLMTDVSILMDNLDFAADVALAEVNSEYSAAAELADMLQQKAGVALRTGHHFASLIVDHGKLHRLKPADFPYDIAKAIYAEEARTAALEPTDLPLTEREFHQALSSQHMVDSAAGLGGPQAVEVDRMLMALRAALSRDTAWVTDQERAIHAATQMLDRNLLDLIRP